MPSVAYWIQRAQTLVSGAANESPSQTSDADGIIRAATGAATISSLPDQAEVDAPEYRYRNLRLNVAGGARLWAGDQATYEIGVGNGRMRIVGECWGMSPLSHPAPGGALLRTVALEGAPRAEWEQIYERVRCKLGATFAEANACLPPQVRNLANLPGFSGLTVAGCIGVGGHGSGLKQGPLASMVHRIQFGNPWNGQPGPAYERGDPNFDLAVIHLGRLGPVREVELNTVPAYNILQTRTARLVAVEGVGPLVTLLEDAIQVQARDDVHSVEIWIAPYPDAGNYTAAFGVRQRGTPAEVPVTFPLTNHNPALVGLGYLAAATANQFDQVSLKVPALLRAAVRLTAHEEVRMTGVDGLDFGYANSVPAASIELAINLENVEHAARALHAVLAQLNEMAQAKSPRYILSPIGIRFTGPAPARSLAPQAGGARTMHVEIPTFNLASCHADEILAPIQKSMAKAFKARPHWGQRIYLTPEELAPLWPYETRRAFAALAKRLDPRRRYATPLLDAMLAVPQ